MQHKLSDLLAALSEPHVVGPADISIDHVRDDSRQVAEGDLFVALRGPVYDGHQYLEQAVSQGAICIVINESYQFEAEYFADRVTVVRVANTQQALWQLAAEYYGHPSRQLSVIGITGTNGKTSVAFLTKAILEHVNIPVGMIGTLGCGVADELQEYGNTTPGPLVLQELLRRFVSEGITYVVMEVSSHAIHQERIGGISFYAQALTSITSDHLDYHGTLEEYRAVKTRFFSEAPSDSIQVLNMDDSLYETIAANCRGKVITYSKESAATVFAKDVISDLRGTRFSLCTEQGETPVVTSLVGRHNLENILAAVALAEAMGIAPGDIAAALEGFSGVPGRLEPVMCGQPFSVFIDYAHTADGLSAILTTLREQCAGRIILVFGCGGDRDTTKRAPMGRVAETYADRIVITDDNPRHESPGIIVEDISKGLQRPAEVAICHDRKQAIQKALSYAAPKDVVIIAGKGHEKIQIVGDDHIPFSDKAVAEEILCARTANLKV